MRSPEIFFIFARMNDLARHIEALLVDNDCVIVPGLGGFIIHYTPAVWMEKDNMFLPPTRMIGFNARLKVNDGLLVQSYMTAHHVDFAKAAKLVEKDADELLSLLHTEGEVSLGNIGQLHLSIHNALEFIPGNTPLCAPAFYGLESFGIRKLEKPKKKEKPAPRLVPVDAPHPHKPVMPRIQWREKAAFLSNAVAVVAIIILCFALSIPVENTEVVKGNYAQLLPTDAFCQMKQQSLAITPLAVKKEAAPAAPKTESKAAEAKKPAQETVKPVAEEPAAPKAIATRPKETRKANPAPKAVAKAPKTSVSPRIYHIIIASVGTTKDAENMARSLRNKGFANAKAIIGGGKMRVCIDSYASEAEAYSALNRFRKDKTYQNAWILKKK